MTPEILQASNDTLAAVHTPPQVRSAARPNQSTAALTVAEWRLTCDLWATATANAQRAKRALWRISVIDPSYPRAS